MQNTQMAPQINCKFCINLIWVFSFKCQCSGFIYYLLVSLSSCSCWISNDIAFYVGVVAYFVLIFALCLLVFIMVMVQLTRIKKQNPHNQSPKRGVLTDLRSITGLIILLGLTWGFALFAWGPLLVPFVYLFSIFNSLQGQTCTNTLFYLHAVTLQKIVIPNQFITLTLPV